MIHRKNDNLSSPREFNEIGRLFQAECRIIQGVDADKCWLHIGNMIKQAANYKKNMSNSHSDILKGKEAAYSYMINLVFESTHTAIFATIDKNSDTTLNALDV